MISLHNYTHQSFTFTAATNKSNDGRKDVLVMAARTRNGSANGKEPGFNIEADFIPFELSDVDEDIDTSRPDSRASYATGESVTASQRGAPALTNGEGRKRKRKQIESSPERGPPTQRPKLTGPTLNPWQTDLTAYASLSETARMYATSFPH